MGRIWSSTERVAAAMSHQVSDRVPVFLGLTYQGARELDMRIDTYLSRAEHVVRGQLQLQKKFKHDCVSPFFYAAIESEAFGGEVVYFEECPPNAGEPFIKTESQILKLVAPTISECPCLVKGLQAIVGLKAVVGNEIPILGTVIAPFSLPVMQVGFERYIELLYERPDLVKRLLQVNEIFCIEWAKAQFKAGATAISYVDPCASANIIETNLYQEMGLTIARRVVSACGGAMAFSLASEKCGPILPLIQQTGVKAVTLGYKDDISQIKEKAGTDLTLVGNLNGIEMCRWSEKELEQKVKQVLEAGQSGGGFIFSESTGDLPYQVGDDLIFALMNAVDQWGRFT